MKTLCLSLILSIYMALAGAADDWQFDTRVAVTEAAEKGVYVHLEGAGRKHIAVSDDGIAIIWEDNRSGSPQIHLSTSMMGKTEFSRPVQLSTGTEAYEPAIAYVNNNQFIAVWEQDSSIYSSIVGNQITAPVKLSNTAASHATVVTGNNGAYVVWRENQDRKWRLKAAELKIDNNGSITITRIRSVEENAIDKPVLMPSVSYNEAGLLVAWEDRRKGHTRILYSFSSDQGSSFSQPEPLNEFFSDRNEYDKGNGVTRVAISSLGQDEVIATWMDKRRGGKGYGIFAVLGAEGGAEFGPNEKVHDQAGDALPHYNPSTAGNQNGDFAIAWDDYRNGELDIWISNYNDDEEWTDDFSPEVASGNYEQSHPSITISEDGSLHLIWIERKTPDAPGQLWYSKGISKINTQ